MPLIRGVNLLLKTSPVYGSRSYRATPLLSTAPSSSSSPVKVPVSLIASIRSKRPGTSLTLAKQALATTNLDVEAALQWITTETTSGSKAQAKQDKLSSRTVSQGLIGMSILKSGFEQGVRVGVVEVKCETDFVARTEPFKELVNKLANTIAFFAETTESTAFMKIDFDQVKECPIIPLPNRITSSTPNGEAEEETVSSSITSAISRLGENIQLSRIASLSLDPAANASNNNLLSSYLHGSLPSPEPTFQVGTLAGLILLQSRSTSDSLATTTAEDLTKLGRQLARQVVAYPTTSAQAYATSSLEPSSESEGPSAILYEQPVLTIQPSEGVDFAPNETRVDEVLTLWGKKKGIEVEVTDLIRWSITD